MIRRSVVAAALLSATLLSSASAQQQTWVAVASDGAGLWGAAVGMATREAAEASAIGQCGVYCRLKFTAMANCVAYAFSDTGRAEGFGAAPTQQPASQQAWAECNANVPANSCTVRTAQCFQ
jgi:hypothetical protein